MTNKEKLDALDTIHYFLNDPNKLSNVQKKAIKNYFNNTATDTSEQNSGGFLKRSGRLFLTNFQPDTFNNSYVNRAYIDAGIDPTSFIKNSYAKYLKSTNKPDTLKLSDNSTGSGDIGVFDTPNNYTPITPNNSMLLHTAIDMRNHFKQSMPITDTAKSEDYVKKMYAKQNELNRQLGAFNAAQDIQVPTTAVTDNDVSPNNAGTPIQVDNKNKQLVGTNNAIGNSIKKVTNQNAKKDTGSAKVDVNPETIKPVLTPEEIGNYYATHGAKKSVPNPKTALNESQSDYYRYLTGYRRMDPNQAILSMGLDPNKYYYQHDPAYYH